jgi:hypothetical protein
VWSRPNRLESSKCLQRKGAMQQTELWNADNRKRHDWYFTIASSSPKRIVAMDYCCPKVCQERVGCPAIAQTMIRRSRSNIAPSGIRCAASCKGCTNQGNSLSQAVTTGRAVRTWWTAALRRELALRLWRLNLERGLAPTHR